MLSIFFFSSHEYIGTSITSLSYGSRFSCSRCDIHHHSQQNKPSVCTASHCSALLYGALRCFEMLWGALRSFALLCVAVRCLSLVRSGLVWFGLVWSALLCARITHLEGGVEVGRRAKLLDVVEMAAVDDREHSEQPLEDGHRCLLEVFRIRRICHNKKTQTHEHTYEPTRRHTDI